MEFFIKVGLKEIANIVQTLADSIDSDNIRDFVEVDGKELTYYKSNYELAISSNDGRNMNIHIVCKDRDVTDFLGRKNTVKDHFVFTTYYPADGNKILLKSTIPKYDEGYEGFRDVQRHDLMTGFEAVFFNNKGYAEAWFDPNLDKILPSDNNQKILFSKEGIR